MMMLKRMIPLFGLMIAPLSAASLLGLGALGEEVMQGDAALLGRGNAGSAMVEEGFSANNPARMVFDNKTRFTISLDYSGTYAKFGNQSMGRDEFGLGSVGLAIPFGGWGALGFGYSTLFTESFQAISIPDSVENASLSLEGSLFELQPALAWRLPGALRMLSLGLTYHVPMGRSTYSHRTRLDTADLDAGSEPLLNSVVVEDLRTSSWEVSDVMGMGAIGGAPGLSLQVHTKKADFFVAGQGSYTLERNWDLSKRLSTADTTAYSHVVETYRLPWSLQTGISYELLANQWFSFEFSQKTNEESSMSGLGWAGLPSAYSLAQVQRLISFGWEKQGTGLFFDPILQRSTLRAGGWLRNWYLEGVNEVALAFGMGTPLGKRGAELDFALYGGSRTGSDAQVDSETFWGFKVGLSGIGSWGSSSRRRN